MSLLISGPLTVNSTGLTTIKLEDLANTTISIDPVNESLLSFDFATNMWIDKPLSTFTDFQTLSDAINSKASTYIQDTVPTGAVSGSMWFNTTDGKMYMYYVDVDTEQWIEAGPQSSGGGSSLLTAISTADVDSVGSFGMLLYSGGGGKKNPGFRANAGTLYWSSADGSVVSPVGVGTWQLMGTVSGEAILNSGNVSMWVRVS